MAVEGKEGESAGSTPSLQLSLRATIIVLGATIMSACAPAPTPISAGAPMAPVSALMVEALVPGVQIARIDNRSIEVQAFGVADARSQIPVTNETVFEAASLGKPVFAYGVLLLASQRRIDLDAPIGRYLQDLPSSHQNLTPRQLLSHSAGLGNSPRGSGTVAAGGQSAPRFSYSGEGYNLLQRVVEQITGQPIQAYMRSAVFEPLGMTSSSYIWRDDYVDRKAFGHSATGSSAGRNRIPDARVASSLETTAGDYARFLVAAASGRGLRPEIAREFLRPQIALEDGCLNCVGTAPAAPSDRRSWALGFGIEKAHDRDFAWHPGDNNTMQSYAAIDTNGRRGVVILANSANGLSIARQIATSVLGADAPGYEWLRSYGRHTEPARRLLSQIVRYGASSLTAADLALPRQDLLRVANQLVSGERASEAAELLRRIVVAGEPTAEELVLLAEAERKAGNLSAARTAATRALRLEPGNSKAQQALSRIGQTERTVPAAQLARYSGVYSSPYGELEIRTDGRRLSAHLIDQPTSEMLPLSDDTFLMDSMGVPIQFFQGPDGAVTHAVVRAGGEVRLPRLRSAP